jgi:hypothetical protein
MIPTSNFEKLCCDSYVIRTIANDLYAAFARVVLCPSIVVQIVTLITSMTCT